MKENTFYFPHDYNASDDEKIRKLVRLKGWESYGLYWALIEKLYKSGGKVKRDYEQFSYDFRVDSSLIKSICEDFELFVSDDSDFLRSKSVDRRIADRKQKAETARASANSRWRNANAVPA